MNQSKLKFRHEADAKRGEACRKDLVVLGLDEKWCGFTPIIGVVMEDKLRLAKNPQNTTLNCCIIIITPKGR